MGYYFFGGGKIMLNKYTLTLFFATLHTVAADTSAHAPAFVTNKTTRDRTGCLLCGYMKAKAVAMMLDLPFLLTPFENTQKLTLYKTEKHCPKNHKSAFSQVIQINRIADIARIKKHGIPNLTCKPILFRVHPAFRPPGNDCSMVKEAMRKLISLRNVTITAPKKYGYLSVAVHVRTGKGYDSPRTTAANTRHFPKATYYAKQIKHLATKLTPEKLYVYIYTDDPNPAKIVKDIQRLVTASNVSFDCRKSGNRHNKNVIEDLLAMADADYFIRGASSYSYLAQFLGSHKEVLDLNSGHFAPATS